MLFSSTTLAVLGLACSASAHMKLNQPVPFNTNNLNNSPLEADGSDFPCKVGPSYSYDNTAATSMALGSSQPLNFIGSAVHGGGSCQVSITYDLKPTKNSVWKVIHSIEGGCPARNEVGNLAENANGRGAGQYSFTIPTTLPSGPATLAWTWFNKVGNREMYMNCAPINLGSGSSKRSEEDDLVVRNITQLVERDQNAYNSLPDMFTANIGNGCTTLDSTDLVFPAPGDSVEQLGLATKSALQPPSGSCGKTVPAGSSPTAAPSAPVTTAPSKPTSLPGGVFLTVPAGNSPPAPVPTAPASSVVENPDPAVTPAPPAATTVAEEPSPAETSAPALPAKPSQAPSTPPKSGSGINTPGTACANDGQWNCIGGDSYQRCGSGLWTVVQPVADGTQCTIGTSDAIIISAKINKRNIRFSGEHIRRHLQKS